MKSLFRWFTAFVGVSLLMMVLYRFDVLGFKSNFALDFVDLTVHFFRKPVSSISLCREEMKALETKNQSLITENQRLRQELMLRVDLTKESLEADVVNVASDQIIINQGASNHVSVGQKVIVGQSMIGVILEVEKNRSLVGLLNNPKTKVNCSAGADKKIWGLLTGEADERIYFTKILQVDRVDVGDRISCSGYLAGKVNRIIKNESDLFYEAEVAPAINPKNLEKVYVAY